ncbi:MAG: hypothetical protein P4L93_07050 [Coriobacteriia bacterium]|nr:hypothetical protein [Coriobacteriia bacterium]
MTSEHGVRTPLGRVSEGWRLFWRTPEKSSEYVITVPPSTTDRVSEPVWDAESADSPGVPATERVRWDRWRRFPTLADCLGTVPIGSGIIWLRNRSTGEDIFIGASDHVGQHLPEMLLRTHAKRVQHEPLQDYVTKHATDIDYRTAPCATARQAMRLGARLRAENRCLF